MKAFPQINKFWKNENDFCYEVSSSEGMDLRDYFAAKALQGLLADNVELQCDVGENIYTVYAETAYGYANAMMEAKNDYNNSGE